MERNSKLKAPKNDATSDAKRRKEINDYLRNKIFLESAIQEAIDTEKRQARMEGGYLVCYEKTRRDEQVKEFLMSCKRHELYPGMLLVANDALGTMTPTEAGIARGKVTINISTFPGTISGGNSREVQANKNGNLGDAVNDAISDICEKFAKSGKSLVADFHDRTMQGMSLDELSIKANCSAKFAGINVAASFEKSKSGYSTYFMSDYTQVFYTASAEIPDDLSSLFADHITLNDIKRTFADKPIIFVKSVNYGRQLYVIEELSGSNNDMLASLSVSYSTVKVGGEYKQSNSKLRYKSAYYINGGDITNANKIFGSKLTQKSNEKDVDYCIRQMDEARNNANVFKKSNTRVTFKGNIESDINGVVLSYKASMICGPNPTKDITFWKSGEHLAKRIIPNTGIRVDVFNTLKDHNVVASGYYTKYDSNGKELPEAYDLYNNKPVGTVNNIKYSAIVDGGNSRYNGRVFCKQYMEPAYSLNGGKNIYRVCLRIRNRDEASKRYEHTYILPCDNILAGYLRAGKKGGERVNWYFGGSDDEWYNGGER